MQSLASPNGGGGGDVHDAFYNRQMRRKAAVVCCAAAGGAAALYLQRRATRRSGAFARAVEGAGTADAVAVWRPAGDLTPSFVHREVFVERCYCRHGVKVRPGDAVVDVGANVGLFAVFASRLVGAGGAVVSFEPASATFQCLERNLGEEGGAGRGAAGSGRAVARRMAIGREAAEAQVTVYPRASGWSTLAPAPASVRSDVACFAASGGSAAEGFAVGGERVGALLRRLVPEAAVRAVGAAAAALLLRGATRESCRVVPLAEALRFPGSPLEERRGPLRRRRRIDLLKVDVERHELDVLHGVDDATWRRVRQVALEVHDAAGGAGDVLGAPGGRVAEVVALLKAKGFRHVVAEQPPELRGSDLHAVFAVR